MSVKSQARPGGMKALRERLDGTKIAGRSLGWYLTGWRLGLIILAIVVLYPILGGDQSIEVTALSVGIYVLLALGLNIVVGYAGLLDLGYVAFFVVGAYTMAVFSSGSIYDANFNAKFFAAWPFWLILPVGAIIAAFFGVLIGAPTLRLRGDYLAIVTLGFGEILPEVFKNVPYFNSVQGMTASPPGDIGPITFSDPLNHMWFYYLVVLIVALVILGVTSLRDSSLGRAWIAIREDETAAAASGVNLVRTKLLAFALGATVGGIAGVLSGAIFTAVEPNQFSFQVSISVLVMIVLGGLGSIPGVILGAIILRFLDVYLLGQINGVIQGSAVVQSSGSPLHFLANFDFNTSKYLIYGLILVIMILVRPQGLIPDVRRKRELEGIGAAPEAMSAVSMFEQEVEGVSDSAEAATEAEFTGAGSDAMGREE